MAEWVSPERAFVIGAIAGLFIGAFAGAVLLVILAGGTIDDNRKGRRP